MESTAQHKVIGNDLLTHTIASYLTLPDHVKCLHLCRFWCRFWHEEFTPYFFRKLAFRHYNSLTLLMQNHDAVKMLVGSDYETNLLPILKNSPRIHTLGLVLGYINVRSIKTPWLKSFASLLVSRSFGWKWAFATEKRSGQRYPLTHQQSISYITIRTSCANTLQYLDVYDSAVEGEAIAAVIQKCISLRGFRWGYNQMARMARHRTSLEEIDVSGTFIKHPYTLGQWRAEEFTLGDHIHKILCSFPRLRRFEALVTKDSSYRDQCISSIELKDSSGSYTNWVCNDLESMSLRFVPGTVYMQYMCKTGALIFPEVLCTQLCRLEKLGKLRLAMEVYLGHDEQQQQDEEEEEEEDPHLTMEEALSNILGSLKNYACWS
ncbi:hypothetical protein BG004_006950 [Podila humilis]|nr:hypothetical protein BG004_006950 [Podila humilis]